MRTFKLTRRMRRPTQIVSSPTVLGSAVALTQGGSTSSVENKRYPYGS